MAPTADWRQLEALLFASGGPQSEERLARLLDTTQMEVRVLLDELDAALQGHGVGLHWLDGTVELSTRAEYGGWLAQRLPNAPGELSRAALEVLALIAYRQPLTRAELDAMRGIRSERTLQTVLELGLVEVVGRSDGARRAPLYGTTEAFLRRFSLSSLADLPEIESAAGEDDEEMG